MASFGIDQSERASAILAVALVHAGLIALLIGGLRVAAGRQQDVVEPIISITLDPPPPREPVAAVRAARPAGRAGKRAEPSPVVAPPAKILAPSPVVAAPVAGTGSATKSGAAETGSGPGAGGDGNGVGGGGQSAQWLSGGLRDSDYPRQALRDGQSGNVSVRFTVLASGRIARCRIARSSGSDALDATTCRLLEQRLRFAPARDSAGNAVESELGSDYGWGIRRR